MHPSRAKVLFAVAIALVVDAFAILVPTPQPDLDRPRTVDEITAEVRAIRAALDGVVDRVASATIGASEVVGEVRLGEPGVPDARLDAVAHVRDAVLADLQAARVAGDDVRLPGASDLARNARQAWRDALAAAHAVERAARADLDHVRELAEADARLAGVVAAWDEPGARSEQLDRLGAARAEAEALAAELSSTDPRPSCSDSLAVRVQAAEFTADSSEQLRQYVLRRDGEAFDELRDELAEDPFGIGAAPWELDAREGACWQEEGATAVAAARHRAAIERLETILNPSSMES